MFDKHYPAIIAHAHDEAPKECVGVIWSNEYIPLVNVHSNPENFFRLSDKDLAKYPSDNPNFHALVHSHPPSVVNEDEGTQYYAPRISPSKADMQAQINIGKPFIITAFEPNEGRWVTYSWGDHILEQPLLEREFLHGVNDCYSLIRKWYWQNLHVILRDYPRNDKWWETEQSMYDINFAREGFYKFHPSDPGELQLGDWFLFQLNARVNNHAGIYIGDGLIAHHAPKRLSETIPVGNYFRRITTWLRRK